MAERLKEMAKTLSRAEIECQPIDALTDTYPDLTVADAYAIQKEVVGRKLKQGRRVRGKKVGFTSPAVQQMLGLDEPGYGYLFDSGEVGNDEEFTFDRLLQPKVEAEIGFVLKNRLRGPGLTIPDILAATDYLVPAFEILDSRILDWKIKAADTIADNASHGLFVIGDTRLPVNKIDLPRVEMNLEKNGEDVATGTGNAVLGNPALSVVWLANKLSELGLALEAGEVILSGSLATPLLVSKGDAVRATFGGLGSVAIRFV
ncbi:MAG: fumarylacetoacetate hydrolase family protein [Pyrinomonadaceae bacterium]|nr:fumarylacetoacetate hydrolase family protein [Pyrinomonadaceae bacterium]